ncbi:hypothetical protein WGM54_14855 [Paenibacillus polymyxa]|uniref:hypothetical protein n=1 Tax=Paenibacillus polymyxa TaxID=1406 RepID=UPI00307E12B1
MNYAAGLFNNITDYLNEDEFHQHAQLSFLLSDTSDHEEREKYINQLRNLEQVAYVKCMEAAVSVLVKDNGLDAEDLEDLQERVKKQLGSFSENKDFPATKKKRSKFFI